MHKGVIIVKNADQEVPEQYLELVHKQGYTNVLGAATISDQQIVILRAHEEIPLNDVMEIMNEYKGSQVVLYFGNYPENTSDDDIQPFSILREGEKDVIISFLEGDFDNFAQAESSHSNEFFAANHLINKFQKLSKLHGGNIQELMKELDDQVTRKELLGLGSGPSSVTFLAIDGTLNTLSTSTDRKDFPWGWVSNTFGYAELGYPSKEEPIKQSKLGAFLNRKTSAVPSVPTLTVEPKKEETPVVKQVGATKIIEQPKPDTAVTPPSDDEYEWVTPPGDLTTNNQLKKWYARMNNGKVPNDFKKRPALRVKKQDVVKAEAPITAKSFEEAHAVLQERDKQRANKDVTPHHVKPDGDVASPTKEEDPVIGIIPPEQLTFIADDFLKRSSVVKAIDKNSQALSIDPSKLPSMENKIPTFAQQNGLSDISDIFRISQKDLVDLAIHAPHAVAKLCSELIALVVTHLPEQKAEPKKEEQVSAPSASSSLKARLGQQRKVG